MTTRPRLTFHLPVATFALAMVGMLTMLATPGLAQTITVLHNFTGGADGSYPAAGVTFDQQGAPTFDSQGNLYAPLSNDGRDDLGKIFQLAPSGDQWLYSPFYQFSGSGAGTDWRGAL